ncbi:MAG TPA: helix-hairpin-helix domain-containing protein [Ferruginibacter sp.]|nr:helix-hairpin-helix domain-containing protein [Ferruginibacter sp.]HMP19611.1 helix-hairpin-helix domain-containing protein [Ferruginibacter sp.]
MWKEFVSGYLSFSKKERTGIIALLALIFLLTVAPFFYPLFTQQEAADASAFQHEIATLVIKEKTTNRKTDILHPYQYPDNGTYKNNRATLFYFDPNTLDKAGWQKLGLREKTIATIQNYINKGGRFRQPEDIQKIWGMSPYDANRLIPYIRIAQQNAKQDFTHKKLDKPTYEKPAYEKKAYSPTMIDINTADTAALISLPGIGSKLSQRIISFREKLGGFYTVDQVAETFGLPDSTFQKIKSRLTIITTGIKKININTATIDELKTHPYIRYPIANAIIQYRTQHGNFSSVNDTRKIMLVTDELFNKTAPYLTVE